MSERYNRPEDLPAALPMFPLRGAILLPRSTLPLTVFEPRYLALIDDVLAGRRVLGIVQPSAQAGEEGAAESPAGKSFALRKVGCAGRLTAFAETPDNRVRVSLTGVARFRIEAERETALPYRLCEVSYKPFARDFERGAGDEAVDRKRLLDALKAYLDAHRLSADWDSIERSPNELLVNTLSMISPYGPEEKQALLEAPDLKARAEALMALAQMDLASPDDGSGTALQ